mgnify:CR=1 FL=1
MTATAFGNFGRYEKALSLIRATGGVLTEGPFGQAHRVYGNNNHQMVRFRNHCFEINLFLCFHDSNLIFYFLYLIFAFFFVFFYFFLFYLYLLRFNLLEKAVIKPIMQFVVVPLHQLSLILCLDFNRHLQIHFLF